MKFSYEVVIDDINNLVYHINYDCDGRNYSHIIGFLEKQYRSIISHTPYDWYFCDGLEWEDVNYTYESIKCSLETLKDRLVNAQKHAVIQVEAVFGEIKKHIIHEICGAESQIQVAVAWLSDKDIVNALIEQAKLGVIVKVILHKDISNDESIGRMREWGITIYEVPGTGKDGNNIMHNKFAVIDGKRVITGSYNWSSHAALNVENIVIIVDEVLARNFANQYNKLTNSFAQFKV